MSRLNALPHLDATGYARSVLHAESCAWVEKNCYVDIWIEVLHALGLEPRAILPFTVTIDFEGDQWTFFKPPHDELRELYGVDVQESFRVCASQLAQIFAGTPPGDIPVEEPTKVELVVNLKVARELGVVIPDSVLARVDRVIQ